MSGASQGLRVASAGAGEAYADIDVADDQCTPHLLLQLINLQAFSLHVNAVGDVRGQVGVGYVLEEGLAPLELLAQVLAPLLEKVLHQPSPCFLRPIRTPQKALSDRGHCCVHFASLRAFRCLLSNAQCGHKIVVGRPRMHRLLIARRDPGALCG